MSVVKRPFSHQVFHREIETCIQLFNRIALNPYEKITLPKMLYQGLPITWNITQIYYNILYLFEKQPFPHTFFIMVDADMHAVEGILLNTEKITETDEHGRNKEFLEWEAEFFDQFQNDPQFMEKLDALLKSRKTTASLSSNIRKDLQIPHEIHCLIFPLSIRKWIADLNLPSLNSHTLGAISKILSWKSAVQAAIRQGVEDPLFYMMNSWFTDDNFKQHLINWVDHWNNADINQWLVIVTTLLDDLMTNILVVSEDHQKLLFGAKIMVENNRMNISALPNYYFRNLLDGSKTLGEIAKVIYERTGIRTQIMQTDQIKAQVAKFQESDMGIFDFFSGLFELNFTSQFYPDSLLNSFLKLFGLELGAGMAQFSNAIKTVTRYFEKILIVTFQDNVRDESLPYEALVEMSYQAGKYSMNLLDTQDYKALFRDHPQDKFEHLKRIKEGIEAKTGVHYSGCFGFNIDLLSEYFSAKNIQAFLKMSDMAHQLPFIATLGALFVGMKGMKADQNGDPLVEVYDEPPSDELLNSKLQFHNYIDGFMKKGMLFIGDPDKSMENIRSQKYAKEGYLGIDMEALRQFIEKRSP